MLSRPAPLVSLNSSHNVTRHIRPVVVVQPVEDGPSDEPALDGLLAGQLGIRLRDPVDALMDPSGVGWIIARRIWSPCPRDPQKLIRAALGTEMALGTSVKVSEVAVFETPTQPEMAGFRYYERTSPCGASLERQKRVQTKRQACSRGAARLGRAVRRACHWLASALPTQGPAQGFRGCPGAHESCCTIRGCTRPRRPAVVPRSRRGFGPGLPDAGCCGSSKMDRRLNPGIPGRWRRGLCST